MNQKVLITYATRYGSTREVAEKVAVILRERGLESEVLPVAKVKAVADFAAVVLGTPFYFGAWPKEVHNFLDRNQDILKNSQIAIFTLGPTHKMGEDFSEEKEQITKELARYAWLTPLSVEMFGGKYDPARLRFPDSLVAALPASPLHNQPFSDLRDWGAIQKWAEDMSNHFKTNNGLA